MKAMNTRRFSFLPLAALVAAAVAMGGCADPYESTVQEVSPPAASSTALPAASTAETAATETAEPAGEAVATDTSSAPATDEAATRRKAEFGVGKRGHDLGSGVLLTPVSQYLTIREHLAFNVQIPQAMNLYKAEHDNKGPKSHEEFMDKIIEFNHIQLPELPEGSRYVYDPKRQELMVESRQAP